MYADFDVTGQLWARYPAFVNSQLMRWEYMSTKLYLSTNTM